MENTYANDKATPRQTYMGIFSAGPSFSIHDFSRIKQNVPDISTRVPNARTTYRWAFAPGEFSGLSCWTLHIKIAPKINKNNPIAVAKISDNASSIKL
jgi:hypothetical protein